MRQSDHNFPDLYYKKTCLESSNISPCNLSLADKFDIEKVAINRI